MSSLEFFNGLSKYEINLAERMNKIITFDVEAYHAYCKGKVDLTHCIYRNTVLRRIKEELIVEEKEPAFALKNGGAIFEYSTEDYGGWFFVINGEIQFFSDDIPGFDEELECWMSAWNTIKGENSYE